MLKGHYIKAASHMLVLGFAVLAVLPFQGSAQAPVFSDESMIIPAIQAVESPVAGPNGAAQTLAQPVTARRNWDFVYRPNTQGTAAVIPAPAGIPAPENTPVHTPK